MNEGRSSHTAPRRATALAAGKGATTGAGRAVGKYFAEAFSGNCDGGVFCGAYVVLVVLLAPVVAIGGSIAGAAGSVSKKDVRKMEAFLEEATSASRSDRVGRYPPARPSCRRGAQRALVRLQDRPLEPARLVRRGDPDR